jgi:predicted lipid carrier protein YhbT
MMNSSHLQPAAFTLPAPVGELLGRLPAWPGSLLFVTALNLALARQLPGDVGQALQDRSLRIHVRDAKLSFDFAWTGGSFAPRARAESPDLTISANARDFLALARREQDPDTLFFSRRLSMEGDTELGLMVKNTLDALELPVFDPSALRLPPPREVLGWLQRRFTSR